MINQNSLVELQEKIRHCRRNDTIVAIHNHLAEWLRSRRPSDHEERMPPVCSLANSLNVARQTIRKVYLQLEAEQLIGRQSHEKTWQIRPSRNSDLQNLALILPAMFSDYYLPGVEYGQRHFGVYSGMADRAMELGYALVPRRLPSPGASLEEIRNAIENLKQHYAGIIHVGERGYREDPPLTELLARRDIPQISIDCEFEEPWIGAVTFDPGHVARTVANCLRENGHRNVGLVYHYTQLPRRIPMCTYLMLSRKAVLGTFRNSLLQFDRIFEIITEGHRFGKEFETQVVNAIKAPDAPTAFWCRDDISAMELVRVLNSLGYSVPKDFSVIGFDDIPAAAGFDPPLTTLRNPIYELGYTAVTNLDRYITRGLDSFERITRLPSVLCVRQSVGAIRTPFRNYPGKQNFQGSHRNPLKPVKADSTLQPETPEIQRGTV